MFEKKNQVMVTIDNCRYCPHATIKYLAEEEDDFMFCQTPRSCVRLRKGWGDHPIPDWCPKLCKTDSPLRTFPRGLRATIPGIIS